MNCIIPGANLKIMNKVLQTLVKIGDELYIEGEKDHLRFAAINQNKTAFCRFSFHPTFFTNFTIGEGDDERITCKLHMKSVFNVFKSKGPKERKVDFCKIDLDEDASNIVFKLKYKQDVTIVHNLRLIDRELINIDYDLGSLPNEISATGAFLQQILNNFQSSDEDMNLEIKRNNVVIRNYDLNTTFTKGIRSQIVLRPSEFLHYKIETESNGITMCFKPFRAAAHFCEGFNLNVALNFDSDGKPVILTIRNPTFDASFILSTISTESCGVSTQTRIERANITVQDQEAIENVNWDSDFEESKEPESPRSKRLKLVFGRCFESTFRQSQEVGLGAMLVPDSDPE